MPRTKPDASDDAALEFIRLLWKVDHELHSVSKRMISRFGLTAPQRLAVRFIGREPRLTLGALAALLHLDPGTVTGIVQRLESAGLVERARGEGDTRRMHLALTTKGQALNRRRKGTVEAAVRRTLGSVTRADSAAAARVLRRLAVDLSDE
jgi:MarR family transcriptional regulator, organic hydroperoxide resistance regulator